HLKEAQQALASLFLCHVDMIHPHAHTNASPEDHRQVQEGHYVPQPIRFVSDHPVTHTGATDTRGEPYVSGSTPLEFVAASAVGSSDFEGSSEFTDYSGNPMEDIDPVSPGVLHDAVTDPNIILQPAQPLDISPFYDSIIAGSSLVYARAKAMEDLERRAVQRREVMEAVSNMIRKSDQTKYQLSMSVLKLAKDTLKAAPGDTATREWVSQISRRIETNIETWQAEDEATHMEKVIRCTDMLLSSPSMAHHL
ncbi:hypothetical protein FRC11_009522, partial [Ceratobasidium sp. 423]